MINAMNYKAINFRLEIYFVKRVKHVRELGGEINGSEKLLHASAYFAFSHGAENAHTSRNGRTRGFCLSLYAYLSEYCHNIKSTFC